MSGESQVTTDYEVIRKWVEERGGWPATVANTGGDEPGILRIEFSEENSGKKLDEISWDDFFNKFEEKRLAFLYQDELKDGQLSRFFKFISRDR